MVFQPSRFYFALIGFNEPASARGENGVPATQVLFLL
jgi:hypothetical protein